MRRGRLAWPFLAGLIVVAVTILAAFGSPKPPASPGSATATASAKPSTAITLPDTPAGAQLRWLIAVKHLPMSVAQIRAHFDAAFRAQVSPAKLNQGILGATDVKLVSIKVDEPSRLAVIVSTGGVLQVQVALAIDRQGLISGLRISPVTPTAWAGVDAAVRLVAPKVRLLVADVTKGTCQPVHQIDPATAAPLGSAFKLYVLDALGNAVASGKARWNQPLTITPQLKSPFSELQHKSDNTRISVHDTAAKMIFKSDNTAADMLINLVSRPEVEAVLTTTGMAAPARDQPFLTTREMSILKLDQWPTLAQRYIAADEAGRRALLAATVDRAPLPSDAARKAWTTPRDIDSLEWFASVNDICRLYTSLAALDRRPGLSPIGDVLSLSDGWLQLDPAQWKRTWYKGGYEPGVLTMAYMATTHAGRSYVVAVFAENPSEPINEATATPFMRSAIRGAFTLARSRCGPAAGHLHEVLGIRRVFHPGSLIP